MVVQKRVLVVDDIPFNCKVLVTHLNKFGIHVDTASNGEHAVSQCMSSRYNIVLMDIEMPVMNGLEATRLIRKYEHAMGRRTPILAVSSFDRPEDRQRCIRAGLDGLMERGLRAEEILTIINSYDQEDTATISPAKAAHRRATEAATMETDISQLKTRFGNKTDEMVEDFLYAAADLFEDFEHAIAGRTSVDVTHVAYSLKGSCQGMGLAAMAILCTEIADDGYNKHWHDVSRKYRRLYGMYADVREWFSRKKKPVGRVC
jgi:CheY-like chemotaxis protein